MIIMMDLHKELYVDYRTSIEKLDLFKINQDRIKSIIQIISVKTIIFKSLFFTNGLNTIKYTKKRRLTDITKTPFNILP